MDMTLVGSLIAFNLVGSLTPGPNNIILMSMGISYGFRRCIPYIAGVLIGFAMVLSAAILGLGTIVEQFPAVLKIVTLAGTTWLAWLGLGYVRDAFAPKVKANEQTTPGPIKKPMGFFEAIAFQWINPKGLLFAFGAATAYIGIHDNIAMRIIIIVALFNFSGLIGNVLWALIGSTLNRLLSGGRTAAALNLFMGAIILGTAAFIFHAGFAGPAEKSRPAADSNVEIKLSDVPENVSDLVAEYSPEFTMAEVIKKTRDGRTYFDVEGALAGGEEIEFDILMTGNGPKIVEIQRDIAWNMVPQASRAVVMKANADNREIVRVIESKQAGTDRIIYEIFIDGKPSEPHFEVSVEGSNAPELLKSRWEH